MATSLKDIYNKLNELNSESNSNFYDFISNFVNTCPENASRLSNYEWISYINSLKPTTPITKEYKPLFSLGEKVTIRDDLITNEYYGINIFVKEMEPTKGQTFKIHQIFNTDHGSLYILKDGEALGVNKEKFKYTDEMFEETIDKLANS